MINASVSKKSRRKNEKNRGYSSYSIVSASKVTEQNTVLAEFVVRCCKDGVELDQAFVKPQAGMR